MQGQFPEAPVKTNKIIVYPKKGESISQLKQSGIQKIDDYGSYWVVRATDAQAKEIARTFGDRAVKANHLNYIELDAVRLDTTAGERAIPRNLQEIDTGRERLRLIQFKGPVKPEWLEQVKAAGNLKVVSYIPHNAYIVWLDANAEQKLHSLLDPQGPLQWIGPYHPYYKIQRSLLTAETGKEGALVMVRVAVVAHSDSEMAQTAKALGFVQSSYELAGQKIFQLDVPQSAVSQIARLPDVLWIEKVMPKRLLDEVQDLVLASQTNYPPNLPPHGPVPRTLGGTNYLDWLTSTVGGGMASFRDQWTYPIVDIADTGLDVSRDLKYQSNPYYPLHPAFYRLGNTNNSSRVVYAMPYWLGDDASPEFGCITRLNELAFRYLEPTDIDGHGTFVASIVAGYDTSANQTLQLEVPTTCNDDLTSTTYTCPGSGSGTITVQVTFTCPDGITLVTKPEQIDFLDCGIPIEDPSVGPCPCTHPETFVVTSRDANGFQLGMGVSPFGQIGINRIWSQNLTVGLVAGVCTITYDPNSRCMNDLPALVAAAYVNGARIQNNSWADGLEIHGTNGGVYNAESQTYDTAVRDALLVGTTNTPGPSPLNQEFIVVFACNSDLGDAGAMGNAGGFGDIRVTAPSTAKNVISVGSSEGVGSWCDGGNNSFDIASFSAAGPTLDGRFKPEIVAPGSAISGANDQLILAVQITLTTNISSSGTMTITPSTNCAPAGLIPESPFIYLRDTSGFYHVISTNPLYTCSSGSSFAAPAVSGGIQLLWWYFENRLTNEVGQALFQPSPAMAKAYLLNSARYLPVTNPQTGAMDTLPSTAQGMGEMDLKRMFDDVPRVIRDESTPRAIDIPLLTASRTPQQTYFSQAGQSYEVSGQVQSNGLPFRVTLAWTDAPGIPFALQELVNELDLDVAIGGQTYKGNVFIGDHSSPGGSYDGVNNIQSVFLPAGGAVTSGAPYTVVVRAANIAGDGVPNVGTSLDQDFALVVYNSDTNVTTLSDVPNLATNNSCATAMLITNNPFSFTNTLSRGVTIGITGTNGYNNVQPSPSAGRGGADEFFKVNLPTPGGAFTVSTTGSTFDNVLSVWQVRVVPQSIFVRGECGALVEVASNHGGFSSTVSFTANGSNDYYIVVEPSNDGPGGTLVLNVNATAPAISVTPSYIQFADEPVGLTSAVQTVTYLNNTTVNIGISTVSIAGSNAADFVIESQGCAGGGIGPGQNCSINVAFAPTAIGPRTAQLVINDDATGSPRIVPLSGNGSPAAPLVCASGSLVFGNQLVGSTSQVQSVTISNCGAATLVISNAVITGVNAGDFAIASSNSCSSVTVGGICAIGVTFTPTALGPRSAALTLTDNAPGSPHRVSLTGNGVGCTPITISPSVLPSPTVGALYNQGLTVSGATLPVTFALKSGSPPSGLSVSTNGVVSGTPTALGGFSFEVEVTDANGCTGDKWYTGTVGCPTITISPAALPAGQMSVAYSNTLTAAGGTTNYAFAQTGGSLPAGLTLSINGVLSGKPTSGSSVFTVTATDANGCQGSRSYTINIEGLLPPPTNTPPASPITVTPGTLPTGTVSSAYNQALSASGGTGPYSFAVTTGALPGGLALSNVGTLSGTPSGAGRFNFTVTATDANSQTGYQAYALSVNCLTITVLPSALPTGTVSSAYSQTLSASGGAGPYSFTNTAGALPGGLALSSAGTLSGTPSGAGQFNFTVTATDTNGCPGSQGYTINVVNVGCNTITLSPSTLATGIVGAAYSQTIMATGGLAPLSFSIASGTLPSGLGLASSGALTGTPTTAGTFAFTATATDAASCTGSKLYSLAISTASDVFVFSASLQIVNVNAGAAVVTVVRVGNSNAPATVQYASRDGTAVAGTDYTATSGSLSFGPDATSSSFSVPILASSVSNGGKTLGVVLQNPTGAGLGDPSASTINIIGSPRTSPVVFTNADGDVVTVKLSGAGAMEVSLVGNGVGPIDQILLTNTDATSSLSVSVKRGKQGDGFIDIGSIVGSSLKSINAPKANVVGDGINLGGALGSVTVNSVSNSRIAAGSQIKSVNVQSFDGSMITAPQIGTVKLVNVNTNAVSGVTASVSIGSVSVSHPKFRWNKSGPADQSIGDFHVQY
jgi:hypothetical protein